MSETANRFPDTQLRSRPNPADTHRLFVEACNAGDVESLVAMYEPDAVIVERNGDRTQGTAAIRSHIERLLAMRPTMRLLGSATIFNGDLAQLSSWWRCSATAPDGSAIEMECHGSELDRRQPDGSWLIVIDNPWGAEAGASAAFAEDGSS